MIKLMTDNAENFADMRDLNVFENAIRQHDEKFQSSLAYPGYTGLGAKPPTTFSQVAAVKSNQSGTEPKLSRDMRLDAMVNHLSG